MSAVQASNLLEARRDGDRVVVSMKAAGGVKVIASTCPVTSMGNAFFLTREHRSEDLVVVTVFTRDRVESYNDYFLPVRWDEEKPIKLEREKLWLPRRQDCLPGIIGHYALEVMYKGKVFTSNEYNDDGTGKILINSRTLLCQFLNGDVELGALTAVVRERVVEQKATVKLAEAEKTIAQLKKNITIQEHQLHEADQNNFDAIEELTNLRAATIDLCGAVSAQVFKRPSVQKALKDMQRLFPD